MLKRAVPLAPAGRGGSTRPSNNPIGKTPAGNPAGRGGSTHDPKGPVGTAKLMSGPGTKPTSKTGKQKDWARTALP